jgi:hypothetical protein
MKVRSTRWTRILMLITLAMLTSVGCGLGLDWFENYDDTCYDCRTVCDGTSGDEMDACLASCSVCQGYSACFDEMEWNFDGMTRAESEWEEVDCQDVD